LDNYIDLYFGTPSVLLINTAYQSIYWKNCIMLNLNEEYFMEPYYFFLKDKGNKVAVYYSVSNTLAESRKQDDVIEVDKEVFEGIQELISKILKSGKKISKEQIHRLIDSKSKKKETDGEIEELVDPDGSIISSSIPILNQRNLAKKTMDQTVRMTKSNQFPFIRIYYGESEEKNNKVVSEVDQSESFGFEETEEAPTYDVANKILKQMNVEDPIERDERLKRLGFDRTLDHQLKQEKKRGKCKNCFTKRRLAELEKEKMDQMLDEILISKKSKDKDMVKKSKGEGKTDTPVYKILMRNIEAVKRLADKEGIDIEKLVKRLKQGE
jgi:hypothetical protein